MSPNGFFLVITALILIQVTHTIGQRKKYRCISEWDRNQRWCLTESSTTQKPEPPRRIELARTQSRPKSPGSRTVILIRKKSATGQEPSTAPLPTSTKSLSYAGDSKPSNPQTKFSPDAFKFLTFPLKFIAALLSPLMPLATKYNASSSPLVNVQVPMTFSMVHSAAPAAVVQTYDANGSPVVCRTQCTVYANNPPAIPCVAGQPCSIGANTSPAVPCVVGQPCSIGGNTSPAIPCVAGQPCSIGANTSPAVPCVAGQPCSTGANTSPVLVPCCTSAPPPQPCNSNANCTSSPPPPPPPATSTNAPPAAPSAATTAVPATSTLAPYRSDSGSPNYTDVYNLLCNLLNQIRPANINTTEFNCPKPGPPLTTAGTAVDNGTETIGGTRPATTSCAPPTEPSTRPTEVLEPFDDGADCTPPENALSCMLFAVRLHKTAACKPPCPPRTKPKPLLCSSKHHLHAATPCPLLHHTHP